MTLVGTLEHIIDETHLANQTNTKPIALILHGTLGHKDYLYQKRLAKALPIDSFRFDFRGNHESTGPLMMSNFEDDQEDLQTVAKYLAGRGYAVVLVVGHSRGSFGGFKWLCSTPEGRQLRGFVNVSGRYRMNKILANREKMAEVWERQGYFERKEVVARKNVTLRIYPDQFDRFASYNNDFIWTECPGQVHILSIHGLADKVVPVYDAIIWGDATSHRSPGTHNLHLIENGDHNLIGAHEEVLGVILDWWSTLQSGTLVSGIWKTPFRPRL